MIKKDFIVLACYEAHMASAALMINGNVVAAVHEERFSRIKMDVGFPCQAALFCMQQANVRPEEVSVVAMVNDTFDHNGVANILFKRQALYSIQDWIDENERFWKPKLLEKKKMLTYFELMGGFDRMPEHYYDLQALDMSVPTREDISETFNAIRRNTVERLLGIPKERVIFLPHYMCHHYHAYYSGEIRGQDVVVLHMEGDGGKCNSAVSIAGERGLQQIGGSNQSDLGRLYQWTTLLLGMKPYHHEYKLMGLAPYATEQEVQKSYEVLKNIFTLEEHSLSIVYGQRPNDLYFYFRDRFEGHRFDGIAGAIQLLVERYLTAWVEMVVEKTGRRRICYGGGVAMNVKANMLLSQLACVEDLFVPLSPGDESNVFGAGYWLTERHFVENGIGPETIPPLQSAYLGFASGRPEIEAAIDDLDIVGKGFHVAENVDNAVAAGLLVQGNIIGRLQGRNEFGQRALGNRSILADPSSPGVVNKINQQIKYRDFWMPFAPTILHEDQEACLVNPKQLTSDYMTLCMPVRPEYADRLWGAIHSGDMTARPQILQREDNPDYYDLIAEVKKHNKVGALINTSFNLHGEPIVGGPRDALHTFLNSGLDAVWMEDMLVSRKRLV